MALVSNGTGSTQEINAGSIVIELRLNGSSLDIFTGTLSIP
jgi:hypothetical protein